MPDGEMVHGLHELLELNELAPSSAVGYRCRCGQNGMSTQAFPGEDVKAKAERAWRTHASRARKREAAAAEADA